MDGKVGVLGVAVTPFVKTGSGHRCNVLGAQAGKMALADAGIDYADVEQCYVGHVFGDSSSGQATVYDIGLTGIPIINVNNDCATGSTAIFLARQAIESGAAACVMVIGMDSQGQASALPRPLDSPDPLERYFQVLDEVQGIAPDVAPLVQLFAGAGRMHMKKYGTQYETFAKLAVKARRHGAGNPIAVFQQPVTLHEVLTSPKVFDPLTALQCCQPGRAAAAVVLCTPDFARRRGLAAPVPILGQAMRTDRNSSFDELDLRKLAGYDTTHEAARAVYEAAGIGPEDVDIVELYDAFTTSELLAYEALGLASAGDAEKFVLDGQNTYGGRIVTNPSGGLLARGHSLAATGVAQCAEIVWHLRDQAGPRQVAGARIALQHEFGLGGASIVTMYGHG